MSTTQQHLLISDVKDDIVLLKTGGGALILQVSAVNFGLLSSREQIAIISSFAQMLNSLSFSIQIVIYSQRLNISSYLVLLEKAQKAQSNPLLSAMIASYREFVQNTIKENDVLDKKFFCVVPLFPSELGLTASKENLQQKIKTVLLPRRDQVIRQLGRVGLKASQVTQQKLLELFHDIYIGEGEELMPTAITKPIQTTLKKPAVTPIPSPPPQQPLATQPLPVNPPPPPIASQGSKTHPFVVEELENV